MCPACLSALYLMAAGLATTSIGGTAAFLTAKQLRRDIRQAKKDKHYEHANNSSSTCRH